MPALGVEDTAQHDHRFDDAPEPDSALNAPQVSYY